MDRVTGGDEGAAARPARRTWSEYRLAFGGRRLPLAFVDLDLFDANVAGVLRRAGTLPVRVASKSVRSPDLLRRILAASPRFQGLLCFSAHEAAYLADEGFDDLLVAYPAWEESGVRAVLERVARGRRIVLTVDAAEQVARLSALAAAAGTTLPVCLDVDLSSPLPGLHFGVRRSPVRSVEAALAVAGAVARAPTLRLDGLLGYEAQIAGVPDRPAGRPLQGLAIRALKRWSLPRAVARRRAVASALRAAGHALRFVNGGGTGSLEATGADASVTEVTAGSAFFSPALFDGYRRFRHLPAAGFALEVTRVPAPGYVTCAGGGYVASGAPGPDRLPRPYLPEGLVLLATEGAGEVQTPLRVRGEERPGLGDPVLFRHAKAGELCEHFDVLLLVSGGRVVGEAQTYRGAGRRFP